MKTISYAMAAEKALDRMAADDKARIEDRLEVYAITGHGDVKALKGSAALRPRVGHFRVIFTEDLHVVSVEEFGNRREIYLR